MKKTTKKTLEAALNDLMVEARARADLGAPAVMCADLLAAAAALISIAGRFDRLPRGAQAIDSGAARAIINRMHHLVYILTITIGDDVKHDGLNY